MKFGICNEIYRGWKIEDTLAHAAGLGYHGLEIAPFTLANSVTDISAAERQKIREAAQRNQIELLGIHWVLVKPEGLYINHPDASIRDRTATYFCDLVDFCADVGGKVMVVGSPKQRNVMPEVSPRQAWDWAAGTFRPAVRQAPEVTPARAEEQMGEGDQRQPHSHAPVRANASALTTAIGARRIPPLGGCL
jgi:sugar phosphate isomerase/epimerase